MTGGPDGFRVERDGAVATITLDVPDKLNRVSLPARGQLAQAFGELGSDESVRVVVLTGAGDAFTAGGDIAGFLNASPEELSRLHDNVAAPERCPKPVLAKLSGYCFGVGLELALACDFRIASNDVELALPEIRLGMIPGSGGTQRLARMVGLGARQGPNHARSSSGRGRSSRSRARHGGRPAWRAGCEGRRTRRRALRALPARACGGQANLEPDL